MTQYSTRVYTIAEFRQEGRQLKTEEEEAERLNKVPQPPIKWHSTKLVLPVPADSAPAGRALEAAQARRTAQVRAQRGKGKGKGKGL